MLLQFCFKFIYDFGRLRHDAAKSSKMANRRAALHGKPHVLHHLAGVNLSHENMPLATGHLGQGLAGERPQRDGTEEPGPDALLASELDALLGNAGRAAERHDQAVGIVTLLGLVAHLLSLYLAVLLL